MLQMKGEKTKK